MLSISFPISKSPSRAPDLTTELGRGQRVRKVRKGERKVPVKMYNMKVSAYPSQLDLLHGTLDTLDLQHVQQQAVLSPLSIMFVQCLAQGGGMDLTLRPRDTS